VAGDTASIRSAVALGEIYRRGEPGARRLGAVEGHADARRGVRAVGRRVPADRGDRHRAAQVGDKSHRRGPGHRLPDTVPVA
jgi:hypothetical protein